MTGIEFAFEDPPNTKFSPRSPLEQMTETINRNPGRWIKLPGRAGSKNWAKRAGYEVAIRGKNLYLRKPVQKPTEAPPPKPPEPSTLTVLTNRDAEIRRLSAEGVSVKEIARRMGVSEGRVYQIAPRKSQPTMRVVEMPSLADEMDRARFPV